MLIIECGGITGGFSMYDRNDHDTSSSTTRPYVTPFLRSLAQRNTTYVYDAMYPSVPSTNKALIELLCGITPELYTTWREINNDALMAHCLPHQLNAMNYTTAFISPGPIAKVGGVQVASGFTHLMGRDEIDTWHQQVSITHYHFPLSCWMVK